MVKKTTELSVLLYGKEVGILKEISSNMYFQYSDEVDFPLSLSLPFKSTPYTNKYCKAYFGGLLPESDAIRKALGKMYKINDKNDFALLSVIGRECAGAVSFYPVGTDVTTEISGVNVDKWLTEDELSSEITKLPMIPMGGKRLSLAGAQTKMLVCVSDGKIGLPVLGSPSTHILKPNPPGYDGLIYNEYLCMSLAKSIGIVTSNVSIGHTNDDDYILIERYDRINREGEILRLHQEDFTQATSVLTQNKYDFTISDCARVLNKTSVPGLSKDIFVKLIIFNIIIGNCDAHGKNYSIQYNSMGTGIELTPAYDLVCTRIYPQLDKELAMKIGNHAIVEEIVKGDWVKFAKVLEINPNMVFEELNRQLSIIPEKLSELVNNLGLDDNSTIVLVAKFINENCQLLNDRFK